MLRIRRNDREGISLSGLGETARAIGPAVSRIGAIDTKSVLFATGFFGVSERTMRFIGFGRIKLRDQGCGSGV